jgi:tetratricopeptide (TPR) repeat protein
LILLAASELKNRNGRLALGHLKKLTPLRRSSEDWTLLGMSYRLQNEPREALAALEHALSIRPDLPTAHAQIAEVHRQLGNDRRAKEHEEKAKFLQQR